MASYAPPEVMSPTCSTSLKSSTHTSIFHSSDPKALHHIDDDRDESVPAETKDDQIRVVLASHLFLQETDAEDDLGQIYHTYEESLFKRSQSVSERTVKPSEARLRSTQIQSRSGG